MDNSWCYPTFWTHLFYIHYIQQEQKGIYIYMYIFYFNCYYFIPSFSFKYTVFSKTIIESFYKQWFKSLSKFSWYYKKKTPRTMKTKLFSLSKILFLRVILKIIFDFLPHVLENVFADDQLAAYFFAQCK